MLATRARVTRRDREILWRLFGQAIVSQVEAEQATDVAEMAGAGLAIEMPSPLRVIAFRPVNDLADVVKTLRQPGDVDMEDHAIAYEVRHEALYRLSRNGDGDERATRT